MLLLQNVKTKLFLACYDLGMRTLKDFEKELNKCSKCGLCQQACPIYKITQNECAVSKGKFIMLHGVTKGELKLSKKVNKYLDMCLKCGKCNDFCPSGIDVCQILNTAKYEYVKNSKFSRLVFFLQSRFVFSNIIKLFNFVNCLFNAEGHKTFNKDAATVLYFKGCVNQVFPFSDKYIKKIFKNIQLNILSPDFECCGLPFLSEGNMKRFEDVAKNNSNLIKSSQYNYIVSDCASCEDTLLNYPKYIKNLEYNSAKFMNWGDLIADYELRFCYEKPLRVTFHKPCHLKDDSFFEKIMNNCENVEYIKMKGYDDCCGLSGSFFIKNPAISKELMNNKCKNIIDTEADYVITTCPACLIGLKKGLRKVNSKIKVVSLLEFLARGCK